MFTRNKLTTPKRKKMADSRTKYALNLLSSLDKLRAWEYICDFTIKSGNEAFPVHRTVLAACSEYFQQMLLKNTEEARTGVLELDRIDANTVKQCIEFMYSGEVTVTLENVEKLLSAADHLKLPSLVEQCLNFLQDNITVENCLSIKELCVKHKCEDVKKTVEKFIKTNFEDVISSEDFGKLSKPGVIQYLKDEDVADELLWQTVVRWVRYQEWTRRQHLFELASITVGKFSSKFILQTVWKEPLVQNSKQCKDWVVATLFSNYNDLQQSIDEDNCFLIRKLYQNQNHSNSSRVRSEINLFFIKNFEKIATKDEFVNLEKDEIFLLFKSPKAKYSSEKLKWQAAVAWVHHDEYHRRREFPELFKLIKLQNLSSNFIQDVVRAEPLVEECALCKDLIMDALYAHASNEGPSPPTKRHLERNVPNEKESPKKKAKKATPKKTAPAQTKGVGNSKETSGKYIAVLDRTLGVIRGLSLADTQWKVLTKPVSSLESFYTIASVDESLYLLSGCSLMHFEENKRWKKLTSMKHKPSKDAKVVTFQKRIYVVSSERLSLYSPILNMWKEDVQSFLGSNHFCVAATDDHIYVIGGGITCSMANSYNPVSESWSILAPMENPRIEASATAMNDLVYVLGGTIHSPVKTVSCYHPKDNIWSEIPNMQMPRTLLCSCTLNGKIYAVGGSTSQHDKFDNIEVYEKEKGKYRWRILHKMTKINQLFSACVVTL